MKRFDEDFYGPSEDVAGFLNLGWHGAHGEGQGIDREIDCQVPLAERVGEGQFGFFFCSTACLRTFLNRAVDELEEQVVEAREE